MASHLRVVEMARPTGVRTYVLSQSRGVTTRVCHSQARAGPSGEGRCAVRDGRTRRARPMRAVPERPGPGRRSAPDGGSPRETALASRATVSVGAEAEVPFPDPCGADAPWGGIGSYPVPQLPAALVLRSARPPPRSPCATRVVVSRSPGRIPGRVGARTGGRRSASPCVGPAAAVGRTSVADVAAVLGRKGVEMRCLMARRPK